MEAFMIRFITADIMILSMDHTLVMGILDMDMVTDTIRRGDGELDGDITIGDMQDTDITRTTTEVIIMETHLTITTTLT